MSNRRSFLKYLGFATTAVWAGFNVTRAEAMEFCTIKKEEKSLNDQLRETIIGHGFICEMGEIHHLAQISKECFRKDVKGGYIKATITTMPAGVEIIRIYGCLWASGFKTYVDNITTCSLTGQKFLTVAELTKSLQSTEYSLKTGKGYYQKNDSYIDGRAAIEKIN